MTESEIITPEETGLSSLVATDLWAEVDSTFVPALHKDLPIEQRREAVREVTKKALQAEDKLQLVMGEMLYEIQETGYWNEWVFKDDSGEIRKFKTFDEYLEHELDFKKRKAQYLIAIYKKFVVDLSIPKDELRSLEWSKAKELIPVIDGSNWVDLLDKIKSMTVAQVRAYVDSLKAGEEEEEVKKTAETVCTMKFKLFPEQAERIELALESARRMSGSDKPGHLLDMICSDFISGLAGSPSTSDLLDKIDIHVRALEKAFGVKISVEDVDTGIIPALASD